MTGVVVCEVVGGVTVSNDEELDEAQERARVAVTGIVLVLDNLLNRAAGIDSERLELDLQDGHAVDQQNDIVAMMAIVSIDAQLADDLEGVLAPVIDVHEGVVERGAIVADEGVAIAKRVGGVEDIGSDDFLQETLEFAVG